jgi:hypothetical protein
MSEDDRLPCPLVGASDSVEQAEEGPTPNPLADSLVTSAADAVDPRAQPGSLRRNLLNFLIVFLWMGSSVGFSCSHLENRASLRMSGTQPVSTYGLLIPEEAVLRSPSPLLGVSTSFCCLGTSESVDDEEVVCGDGSGLALPMGKALA